MKSIKIYLAFIALIVFLGGCSHEDDNFNNELYQTQWKGTLEIPINSTYKKCNITISFLTTSGGEYSAEDFNSFVGFSSYSIFNYSIDNKIITISGGYDNGLYGEWWIVKSSKNTLVLKRNPNTQNESTLTIKQTL